MLRIGINQAQRSLNPKNLMRMLNFSNQEFYFCSFLLLSSVPDDTYQQIFSKSPVSCPNS